jgi:hypothetical protein
LSPPSIVYWLRLGSGVLAGLLYNILLESTGLRDVYLGTLGLISVAIGVYAITIFLVRYVFGWGPDVLQGPNKYISIGLGSYIIWTLFTTMIVYTILEGPSLSHLAH